MTALYCHLTWNVIATTIVAEIWPYCLPGLTVGVCLALGYVTSRRDGGWWTSQTSDGDGGLLKQVRCYTPSESYHYIPYQGQASPHSRLNSVGHDI